MIRLSEVMERLVPGDELEPLAQHAQESLQRRQSIAMLESMVAEKERLIEESDIAKRKTRFPFGAMLVKKSSDPGLYAAEELESIRMRVAHERKQLVDGDHKVHHLLHLWLLKNDPEYQKSAQIESGFNALRSDIDNLASSVVDLLARYGASRNEIAVGYDPEAKMLSLTALAALDRLIYSYELFMAEQEKFGAKIDCLNTLVEGPLYGDMRLSQFNQLVPPDCRRGMDYAVLRQNFEDGAKRVKDAIHQLQEYIGKIGAIPGEMSHLLYNYREELWRRYISELESGGFGPVEAPAPVRDKAA